MHCRPLNIIVPLTLFMLMHVNLHAQQVTAKVTVDRTTILIGEPIKLSLEASVPVGTGITWFRIDSIPHFEITEQGDIDSLVNNDGKFYRQQFTITSFDSGQWTVPAFVLQSGRKRFRTDTLRIAVTYSPDTAKDYHDIREIIDVEGPKKSYWPWILAGLPVLLLILAWLILRKKTPLPQLKEPASKLSPLEEAMQALDALQKEELPQKAQAKQYYTRMNDILRMYVMRKFRFSSLEKTNDEIILQLRQLRLPQDEYTRLAQTLRMADFVKFAKYTPSVEEQEASLQTIKQSVTKMDALAST